MLHVTQRPKVDPYPDEGDFQARMFLLIRMIQLREGRLHSEQITMFLGHNTVITFQETHGDVWDPIRQRLNVKGSRLRSNDASFLVYSLVDSVVDHCFPILEYYGDKLHELEEEVLDNPNMESVQRMHELNREFMLLRRQVWPMRDVIQSLQRETHECMSDITRTYLRDVYDHIVQVIDMIETYREIAASIAETYATLSGNKLNEVVKVLTVLTAIFTPPMFLASVYGMNFKVLPELNWQYGYVIFWVVSIISSVGLVWWLKRREWL
ncbi:MAG: magnesium/cobalt transporter CorA [Phycisphaerales bacterium]|nr:magnesium/cobalt transporter CorA [Phycisphaerales bacterium]